MVNIVFTKVSPSNGEWRDPLSGDGGRLIRSTFRSALASIACVLLFGSPAIGQTESGAAGETGSVESSAPTIVVLPFRVHSAKQIDFLGTSLANLVRERLEADGQVVVLDPAKVDAVLAGAGRDLNTDDALRALAAEIGADFVVAGSVTELAGSYSLDMRLTPAAVGQPSHTRVITAERDDELLDLVNELADRIHENVIGFTPATVARVEVRGLSGESEDVAARLKTRVGAVYDPATLRDDLADLRGDSDFSAATAETERTTAGVVVRFTVIPAETIGVVRTEERLDTIVEVKVRGNRRIESDAIRARIGSKAGHPYNASQIARDVEAVHALGFFRNISVFIDRLDRGTIVIFEVEENPVVREISISGNDNVDGDKILDILTLTTGSTLDYPLLYENRERIASLYRAQGYYLAEVGYQVEPLNESAVGIHFDVVEGKKLKLRSIDFHGNQFFSDRELREGFSTKTWKFWSYATSWFDKSGTYSEPLFFQDLQKIDKQYQDAGFVRVSVGQPEVVPSEEGLTVSVPIKEGVRYKVGKLDVTGDQTVDIEALERKLALADDEYFNRSHLTQDVDVLTEHYTNRGFYFASVTPLPNFSESGDVVDVIFQVRKGPLYFIRQVDISGNTVTVDPVIRREIPIVEGQLYSKRALLISQIRVDRLGFFEEVDFRPEPTEEPDQLDLQVSVVERPTGSFSFGAGYSSQDGFVVTGSLAQSNLFGRGYGVNLSADIGGQTQRFFVSLQDPAFLGSTYSAGLTIFRTSLRFEDFNQEQFGGEVVVGHALSEDGRSRGALRYGINVRKINDDRQFTAAAVILREVLAQNVTSSTVGLSFSRDTRNDRFAATEGYQLAGNMEYAGLGFTTSFLRVEGRAAFYLGAPRWLLSDSTFVLATRVGYALPFNSIADFQLPPATDIPGCGPGTECRGLDEIDTDIKLPLSERYFLGGLGAFPMRGFKARSLGPRRAILQSIGTTGLFEPLGYGVVNSTTGQRACLAGPDACNSLDDKKISDFNDLRATDVIGGNKFISTSFEYRFPISETVGLQGVAFIDIGNAFAEGDNLFDVQEWRYGTGAGVQWFSPFGPLAVVLGWPLDALSIETTPVFEFSVGGGGF